HNTPAARHRFRRNRLLCWTSWLGRRPGGDELANALRADPASVLDQHLSPHHCHDREPRELPAIPQAVVAVGMQIRERHLSLQIRVDDDDVGVAADGDNSLARIEAEQLGY